MDRLSKELALSCLSLERRDDASIRAAFRLAPDFIGFAGHFPGRPILPAVAQVQMGVLAVTLREAGQLPSGPTPSFSLPTAKFTSPVGPEALVHVHAVPETRFPSRWQVTCTVGETRVSAFTLDMEGEVPHAA